MNKIMDVNQSKEYHSEEQWLADLAIRDAWKWDGADIEELKNHFEWYEKRGASMENEAKYLSTVPAELRDHASYVTNRNEMNSEDYHQHFIQVLGCDVNGKAIVKFTTMYAYEDVDDYRFEVMPIETACAKLVAFKKIYLSQTNEDAGSDLLKRSDDSPSP